MALTRRELPVLIANLIYIPIFTVVAATHANYEFLLYVVVVVIVATLVIWRQHRIRFDMPVLWGLTAWGLLHMAGGNLRVKGDVLYGLLLIPIVDGPQYTILRYDQFVHMFGFAVATQVCYHLLRPYLREGIDRWFTVSLLVVLMGSGLGAINEIVEFFAVLTMPQTGVGGYENTLLDLVFNLVGGILAVLWLAWRRQRPAPTA